MTIRSSGDPYMDCYTNNPSGCENPDLLAEKMAGSSFGLIKRFLTHVPAMTRILTFLDEYGVLKGDKGDKGDRGQPGGNVMSVGLFGDLSNIDIPVGTNRIRTQDGTDYIADPIVDQTYVNQHPRASIITRNGRGFKLAFTQRITVQMFGAPANGVNDDYPAFIAALAYLKTATVLGGYAGGTPTLYLPSGKYRLNQTINLKQSLRIQGEGSGFAGGMPTQIITPAGVTPIIVNNYITFGDGKETSPTGGADGSIIDGIAFVGAGKNSLLLADGIWLRARAQVSNCYISGFSRNGVRITASGGGGGIYEGNANGFTLSRLRIEGCGDDGIFAMGADANAGAGYSIDVSSCGGSGINDSSFLGNNWYSCNAEVCGYGSATRPPGSVDYAGNSWAVRYGQEELAKTTIPGTNPNVWVRHVNNGGYPAWSSGMSVLAAGPYLSPNDNARTTFFGCYAEAGMGPSQGSGRAQCYGCFFEENGVVGGMNWVWNRLGVFNSNTMQGLTDGYTAQLAGDSFSNQLLRMVGPQSAEYRFKMLGKDLYLDEANLIGTLRITSYNSDYSIGGVPFRSGMAIPRLALGRYSDGDFSSYGRQIGMVSGPSDLNGLTIRRGDIFYYSFPSAGTSPGMVCTTGGIAGSTAVFKQMAILEA